jgi:asparagine synthase (glutamine-hydrolysing)
MNAICGILGKVDHAAVDGMARALAAQRDEPVYRAEGEGFLVASSAATEQPPALLSGAPRDESGAMLDAKRFGQLCREAGEPRRLLVRGPYAAAVALNGGSQWWLLRDRIGREPLYYIRGGGFVAFASTLRALLASGLAPKRLNLLGVERYLTLRCVPGPESIIHGVYHVQPGQILEVRDGAIAGMYTPSWDFATEPVSREYAARRLHSLLDDAIVGHSNDALLWSAGLDSAALAALQPGLRPVFVTLERSWQDEARLAKESARRMRRRLEVAPGKRFTEDAFYRTISCLDEPIADPSVFPLWLVAEAASGVAKSFVTGHGADELLGGYPRYHYLQKARDAHWLVPAGLMSDLLPALPPNAFIRRGSRYLASIRDPQQSYLSLVSVFDQGEREDLYTDAMKSAVYDLGGMTTAVREHFIQDDLTRNVLALDLTVGIPNLLMAKCDCIAAAHDVAFHFPYLDDSIVQYALRLPPEVKFGVRSKPILRLAVKGRLPGTVRLRARRDFRMPQSGRVQQVIDTVANRIITPERVDATGLFRWHSVETIVRSAGHNVYRRRQFWALLMLFAWYRSVMEN